MKIKNVTYNTDCNIHEYEPLVIVNERQKIYNNIALNKKLNTDPIGADVISEEFFNTDNLPKCIENMKNKSIFGKLLYWVVILFR